MTDAYEFGRTLGKLRQAYENMAREILAGFKNARVAKPLTYEQREIARMLIYKDRIQKERRIGLRQVRDHARRVRRELGLPDDEVSQGRR